MEFKMKKLSDKMYAMLHKFERWMKLQSNLSPKTILTYYTVIKNWADRGDLMNYTEEWIEDNILLNTTLKPASKKAYILGLRKFYDFLVDLGYRKDNPIRSVKIPHVKNNKPRFFKTTEIHEIFNAAWGVRNKLIVQLLYYTGLRSVELLGLSIKDFDIENRIITVRKGKGDKFREVVFPNHIIPLLEKYCHKYNVTDHLLYTYNTPKREMTYKSINGIFRNMSKKLGFNICAHRFRHSFATHLYNGGASSDAVQALMGHSDFQTTKRYLYVMATTRKRQYDEAMEKIG